MALEEFCNTDLSLSLVSFDTKKYHQEKKKSCSKSEQNFSSLITLALSNSYHQWGLNLHVHGDESKSIILNPQASSMSVPASFSNSRVKRDRDANSEEVEVERVCQKVSCDEQDDEEGGIARKKLRLTKHQSLILEDSFKVHTILNPNQKQALATQLNLRPRQVEVWFQNRRARTKLKQTEIDCELLKKFFETLNNENKRLQKELQELKAMERTTTPFYMQLPAASIPTLCPSCEKIGGFVDDNTSSKFTFSIINNTKPQYYDCLNSQSSAAR